MEVITNKAKNLLQQMDIKVQAQMERCNLLEAFALVDGGLKNFLSILVTTYWTKQEKMPLKALAAAVKSFQTLHKDSTVQQTLH